MNFSQYFLETGIRFLKKIFKIQRYQDVLEEMT